MAEKARRLKMLSLWNQSDVPDQSHSSRMCRKNGVQQTSDVRAMATANAAVRPRWSLVWAGGDVGTFPPFPPFPAHRNMTDWANEFCLVIRSGTWWLLVLGPLDTRAWYVD
jgi:hypothetical protein